MDMKKGGRSQAKIRTGTQPVQKAGFEICIEPENGVYITPGCNVQTVCVLDNNILIMAFWIYRNG